MEETDLNGPHRVKANLKAERDEGGDSVPSTDDHDALSGRVLCDWKKQEPAVSLVEDYHNRDLELFTNGLGDDSFWFCGKKHVSKNNVMVFATTVLSTTAMPS